MRIDVLTLFPNMITPVIKESIIGRAIYEEKLTINVINFRDFSTNKHQKVDDTPYGGGAGMVLQVEPVINALRSIDNFQTATKVIMTPQGKPHNHSIAKTYSTHDHLIILCGHYEGFDERIRQYFDAEISIGDYVLTGGEIAALAFIDSVVRLIPGILNKDASHEEDSFSDGLLEYPHYTRPRDFEGETVPDVLMSGHHEKINTWRLNQAIERTKNKRPDLYKIYSKKTKNN